MVPQDKTGADAQNVDATAADEADGSTPASTPARYDDIHGNRIRHCRYSEDSTRRGRRAQRDADREAARAARDEARAQRDADREAARAASEAAKAGDAAKADAAKDAAGSSTASGQAAA